MTVRVPPAGWVDARVLGALAALGLDVLCLVVGVILATASESYPCLLLLGSVGGLVAAPLVGWRLSRRLSVGQVVQQ